MPRPLKFLLALLPFVLASSAAQSARRDSSKRAARLQSQSK
ncbi:hypothetical protein ACFFLM_07770 [Deinococcus oregonensis]|uniref:Uncharacterized protein n=1 Tax=Deinococcus oregonensis TaxID=1805970 RepID=A0ABV6AWI0_9DEIO